MNNIISMHEITKIYNKGKESEVNALRGINLKIERGETVAIIGPSGSGKSTLLHILGCINKATSGEYRLFDKCINSLSDRQLASVRNSSVGFILQDFGLIGEKNVYENVCIPLLLSQRPFYSFRKLVNKVLDELGIGELAKRKANEISGGQKQRVAIARALVNEPDIILADEPTGCLDSKTTMDILEVFKQLNHIEKTLIVVTHNPVVAGFCDRKLQLIDGMIQDEIYERRYTSL
ncbi:MAG: ABC transporter ATP-binding protein [Eubacteriales bacterium]|nr:ABC transporter ATP-binding protein [Eubacteriales bacterium]